MPVGDWPPSRYRVRAVTDAIMAAMARTATPISRQTANTIAITAMQADRDAVMTANVGGAKKNPAQPARRAGSS